MKSAFILWEVWWNFEFQEMILTINSEKKAKKCFASRFDISARNAKHLVDIKVAIPILCHSIRPIEVQTTILEYYRIWISHIRQGILLNQVKTYNLLVIRSICDFLKYSTKGGLQRGWKCHICFGDKMIARKINSGVRIFLRAKWEESVSNSLETRYHFD